MQDFLTNFLANILSDALLAIALYFILTRPDERRKKSEMVTKSLGLLKAEIQVNYRRANAYVRALADPSEAIVSLFPLRYSRGAWNALKETGVFSDLDDVDLKFYLFRMNEATFVANRNLRKLQLAYLEDKDRDELGLLVETAQKENRYVLETLGRVLQMLRDVPVSELPSDELFDSDLVVQAREEQ